MDLARVSWTDQFLGGFPPDQDGHDYRLRRILYEETSPESPDDQRLWKVAANALAHEYAERAVQHLEELDPIVESPIERALLFALCIAAREHAMNVRYRAKGREFGDFEDMPDLLILEPQAALGEYRVDFLLRYQEIVPDAERPVRLKDGTEIPGSKMSVAHLIIECDGHDFHDRSKEQASRDRARDRELKKLGYDVFRYTGSDIWRNPMGVARDALTHLTKQTWK